MVTVLMDAEDSEGAEREALKAIVSDMSMWDPGVVEVRTDVATLAVEKDDADSLERA